jgi:hypothetical protein
MNDDWVDEMISKATSSLTKWRGGRVKLWEYTPTHRTLTLRVESPAMTGNLHIVCGGCSHVRGPFSWDGCDFDIRRVIGEGGITLADEQGGFELRCGIVAVEENVEPVYYPNLGAVTA